MPEIHIKGHDYTIQLTKNSFQRRAQQYANGIIGKCRQLGIVEDDVEISEERIAIKRAPASVSFWLADAHCHFSYAKLDKFVDNLLVVQKVLDHYIELVLLQKMTIEEFIDVFKEHDDVQEKRKAARAFFDLKEDHLDLEEINKRYKQLAKTQHPDMPEGNVEKFKELNEHHKTLKRELE